MGIKKSIALGLLKLFLLLQLGNAQQRVILDQLQPDETNYIFGNVLQLSPGDTIVIPTGSYGGLRFYDINGLPGMPITIINEGGKVTIKESSTSAFELQRSSYVRITGSGTEGINYGFDIRGTHRYSQGINLTNFTTDIEIDHVEISKAGFAGIMAKTDPNCYDSSTFRSAGFVMRNLYIHHNKIRNTGGEGIYIGYTGSRITHTSFSCNGNPVFAHWLEDVVISDNLIKNTGLDGIQLNLVQSGGVVNNNKIVNYATKGEYFQDFALSIGVGLYDIYNNTIINGKNETGNGLQFLNGFSGSRIFNNVFARTGFYAIFVHNRHEFENHDLGYLIANNTIIQPALGGIMYNTVITEPKSPESLFMTQDHVPTFIVNNLIVDPGNDYEGGNTWKQDQESYIDFNDRSTRDGLSDFISNNLLTRDILELQLKNPEKNNFAPSTYQSPLVNAGMALGEWGIEHDFKGKKRYSGNAIDIGAFELQLKQLSEKGLGKLEAKSNAENDITVYPNPSPTYFTVDNSANSTAKLTLYDRNGFRVISDKNYQMGAQVNVSGLSHGVYYLKMVFPDKQKAFAQVVVGD